MKEDIFNLFQKVWKTEGMEKGKVENGRFCCGEFKIADTIQKHFIVDLTNLQDTFSRIPFKKYFTQKISYYFLQETTKND